MARTTGWIGRLFGKENSPKAAGTAPKPLAPPPAPPTAPPRMVSDEDRVAALQVLLQAFEILSSEADSPRALPLFHRAIPVLRKRLEQVWEVYLVGILTESLLSEANLYLRCLNDSQHALALYAEIVALFEKLIQRGEADSNVPPRLAQIQTTRAGVAAELGDLDQALDAYTKALIIYDWLVDQAGRNDFAEIQAKVCVNAGVAALRGKNDMKHASQMFKRAIDIFERLVTKEGRSDLAGDLENAKQNMSRMFQNFTDELRRKGFVQQVPSYAPDPVASPADQFEQCLALLGAATKYVKAENYLNALNPLDEAIPVLEKLVRTEEAQSLGRGNLEPVACLSFAYDQKVRSLNHFDDLEEAGKVCDRAVAIFNELVTQRGRADLRNNLGTFCAMKADNLATQRDPQAVSYYDRAIALYEDLSQTEGGPDLSAALASVRENRNRALSEAPRASTPVSWEPGQIFLDEFVIERDLGAGAMGQVHLVHSQATGRRFAVKRTLLKDEATRRNFLTEIQTWIDLPAHPNLVTCCFVRTVGNEVSIFAEFVDGGTLAHWIQRRQICQLEQILDVAIQFAWGLQAAHERGVVHQDVKPGNVLLTADGTVKVTDFGLAQAAAAASSGVSTDGLVAWRGFTPAYCSPEQAEGRRLNFKTDIWSWGVSVLEMFAGEVTWGSGVAAPDVLEDYLSGNVAGGALQPLSDGMAQVLRKAFAHDPQRRWASMAEAAAALQQVYQQELGRPYPRQSPVTSARAQPDASAIDIPLGAQQRRGAREWLQKAFAAAGRDPAGIQALLPSPGESPAAQAVAELSALDEARRMFVTLGASGRNEFVNDLAGLCCEQGAEYEDLNDIVGALKMYDEAIRLVTTNRKRINNTGMDAYFRGLLHKARLLHKQGATREALAVISELILISDESAKRGGAEQPGVHQAAWYMMKADFHRSLGEFSAALPFCERAIAIFESAGQDNKDLLVNALVTKAKILEQGGDNAGVLALYNRALELLESMRDSLRPDQQDLLAAMYSRQAAACVSQGDQAAALGLWQRAIAIREPLVLHTRQSEYESRLAFDYFFRAMVLSGLRNGGAALEDLDRSRVIIERLVNVEGRSDLADFQFQVYALQTDLMDDGVDPRAKLQVLNQAIVLGERLVSNGDTDLLEPLADNYRKKTSIHLALEDAAAALESIDRTIEVYVQLIEQGRTDLQSHLDEMKKRRHMIDLAAHAQRVLKSRAQVAQ